MGLAKLDTYDYTILPGAIRIRISSTKDPDIVDILSEIERFNGKIYVEDGHYNFLKKYRFIGTMASGEIYMELDVERTA